jgi:hypothetical protein
MGIFHVEQEQMAISKKNRRNTGVSIMENTPPPRGGKYQPMSFGGKNKKRPREKGGKCGRKGKKGERKRKKGERKLEKRKQTGKINAK